MKQREIIISENGKVSVPDKVMLRDFEIAELFGVFIPTVKGKIKQILKEGIYQGDFSNGGFVSGDTIIPEYYGLDMITALAFRIHSYKANVFREWVLQRMIAVQKALPPLYIRLPHGAMLN